MSAVCTASGMSLAFGDYYATIDRATGASTPDIAIMTLAGDICAVGELKVPWIQEHKLQKAIDKEDKLEHLRHILGQVAQYMKEGELKYGFITNYDETMFLKQEYYNERWVLFHSEPVRSGAKFNDCTADGADPEITLRQAFWHLLACIQREYKAANTMPPTAWTMPQRSL
ncbi:hypothetical protein BJX64DRAFT_287548 [Aspergillus heterothallicus]